MIIKKPKSHRVLSVCIVISGHDHEITWLFPMRCPMVRRVRPWAVRSPFDGSSENRPMSGVFVRSAVRKAVRNVRWPSENRPKGRSMAVRGRCDGIFGLVRWRVRWRFGPRPMAPSMARRRGVRWASDGASDGPSDGALAVVRWRVRSFDGPLGARDRWGFRWPASSFDVPSRKPPFDEPLDEPFDGPSDGLPMSPPMGLR